MKNYNNTQTITVLEENIIKKSRNTLHLVLRQRGFADDIIDSINNEVEKRLQQYLNKIASKMDNMNFDNPEESIKCLLLKKIIEILEEISKEKIANLSEEDKKLIFDILNGKDGEAPKSGENDDKNPK